MAGRLRMVGGMITPMPTPRNPWRILASSIGARSASIALLAWCAASRLAAAGEAYEYAAGEVTLPFAYTARASTAPRPPSLDFKEEHGFPDNCQALVRIDGELWQFQNRFTVGLTSPPARYAGPDIDHMTRREDASLPPGYHMAWFLGGLWYDPSEHKLYAPMHIEAEGINRDGPVAPWPPRKVILATSTDKGKTWRDEGDIITPETYFYLPDIYKFSGSDYSNGLSDFGFYADTRGGYFYIYLAESWLTKGTWYCRWSSRVARCAISDRMAAGKWRFFYNGEWTQPALGGKSSAVAPFPFWGVIYSTYLQKYVTLFPSGGYPTTPEDTDGIYLALCSDLAKQDWRWARFPEAKFYVCLNDLNAEGSDLTTCDQSLRFYTYGDGNTFQRLDITFKEGQTTGADEQPRYSFEPHPESSDRIEGRQTRFVGSESADAAYAGGWSDKADPSSYEGHLRECASSGSVTLTFEGSEVYWRALRSPDSGKADVYIDGGLRKTVDCYSPESTDYEQIVYILTGMSRNTSHTIKVVVRGDKNTSSKGAVIRHIGFEYGAESFKASAGFSSLMGKNNWNYQQWKGPVHDELHFRESIGVFSNYWSGEGNCRIGPDYQIPDAGAVVRAWVAPHGGAVRIEGRATVDQAGQAAWAGIEKNREKLWPERLIKPMLPQSQDLSVEVEQGDSISFTVREDASTGRAPDSKGCKVTWDPVITYVRQGSPAVWTPNSPSNENLALHKYARSKRLWHGYNPSFAVDGLVNTAFVVTDFDQISTGDDWLTVDLGKTYRIDRYVVLSVPPNAVYRPESFVLQRSDDGFSWTDVDSVHQDAATGDKLAELIAIGFGYTKNAHDRIERPVPAFKARYVRLFLPNGKPFSINEFELYYTQGKPVADESKNLNLR
jgi:hypothetical protein